MVSRACQPFVRVVLDGPGCVVALLFALRTLRLVGIPTLAAQASNIASNFDVEEVVSGKSLLWTHDTNPACGEPDWQWGRNLDMDPQRTLAQLSRRTGNEIRSLSEVKQSVGRPNAVLVSNRCGIGGGMCLAPKSADVKGLRNRNRGRCLAGDSSPPLHRVRSASRAHLLAFRRNQDDFATLAATLSPVENNRDALLGRR
jgi:hypothetical protein